MKIFKHPQETWSEAECAKRAKHINRDGLGTVGGPCGLINCDSSSYPRFGQTIRYNGGFTAPDGEWHNAESVPLPVIPDTYEFVPVSSWGTIIRRKADAPPPPDQGAGPKP